MLSLVCTGLIPLANTLHPAFFSVSAQESSYSPLLNLADHAEPSRAMYLIVNKTLKELPQHLQDKLLANDIMVFAQKTTKRSGVNIGEGLQGGVDGELVGNSPGVYFPHAKQVLVSEFRYIDRELLFTERNENVAGVTRHEVGHAVDHVWGRPSGDNGFALAYERDITAMSAAQRRNYHYFIQPQNGLLYSSNGRAEAFAEIFGALYGGGTFQAKPLLEAFPHSSKWINDFLRR